MAAKPIHSTLFPEASQRLSQEKMRSYSKLVVCVFVNRIHKKVYESPQKTGYSFYFTILDKESEPLKLVLLFF